MYVSDTVHLKGKPVLTCIAAFAEGSFCVHEHPCGFSGGCIRGLKGTQKRKGGGGMGEAVLE